MKNSIKVTVVLLALCSTFCFSQKKCEVLKVDISGEYKGDCKNGLAHGKGYSVGENKYEGEFKKGLPNGYGTIIYSDGGKYIGQWKKGLRHGEGKYVIKSNGQDSIKDGIWKLDRYIGKKPVKQYVIIKKNSVSRYTFRKVGENLNQVTIKVRMNGQALNSALENISATSGNRTNYNGYVVFENINSYPFNCEMRYKVPSKFGTTTTDVEFIFKIFEKGEWLVELNH